MRLLFLFSILILVLGCHEKKSNNPESQSHALIKKDTVVKISIKQIGVLRFRKSYADVQFRKVSIKELELMEKANPTADYLNNDTALTKRFQQLKLVKGYEFLEKKFKTYRLLNYDHPKVSFELQDEAGEKFKCRFIKKEKENEYSLIVSDNVRTSQIQVDGHYMNGLKFMLLDIVPGGHKEIVVLEEYYIMNGDNSDIYVYEVK
jgi:hypothetical protein